MLGMLTSDGHEQILEFGLELFQDLEKEVTKENMVSFLADDRGRLAFMEYLKTRHCEENLLCWYVKFTSSFFLSYVSLLYVV